MLEYELVIICNRTERTFAYSIRTVFRGAKDTRRTLEVIESSGPFASRLNAFDAGSEAMASFLRELPY